jgi:hypothetical protein
MGSSCTLNKLTIATNMGPGTTNATFIVRVGTPVFTGTTYSSGMTDALSCLMTGTDTTCSTTGSVSVAAGQFIDLKISLSTATTPAGFAGYWAVSCQ